MSPIYHLSLRYMGKTIGALPRWLSGKNVPANAGDMSSIPGSEDPLKKKMATHSSILAWKIPWTEKPGRLQSKELKKESDMT